MAQQDASSDRRLALGTALAALILYLLTCAPGPLWQDSGMFQYRVWQGDYRGQQGLALAHPLYIALARAFAVLPLGNYAFRVNLFSAVCAAAALGVFVDLMRRLTDSRLAAVCAATTLAVSHTYWTHGVIAEVYSLYALALTAELWLLCRFVAGRRPLWLVVAAGVAGLNTANHMLAVLAAPAYLGLSAWALRRKTIRPAHLLPCAAAYVLGASPYLALIVAEAGRSGSLSVALQSALFGNLFRPHVLAVSVPVAELATRTAQYFALNFPTPLLALAPVGLWAAWREPRLRWFAGTTGLLFAVTFLFAFRYRVPDQYVFFFPCYVLAALFVGLGLSRVLGGSLALPRGSRTRTVICLALALLPVAAYEWIPAAARRWSLSIGKTRQLPYRDTYAYFLRPRKNGEVGPARFAREALDLAAPDGFIVADATVNNPIVCVRDLEGRHRGVTISISWDLRPIEPRAAEDPETLAPFVARGRAFACATAAPYVPKWMEARYTFEPCGVLFRLRDQQR